MDSFLSPPFAPAAPDRIRIVRLSATGDTGHALAGVRNLQDTRPDTHITWIIGRTEAALPGDIEAVEFIIFEKTRRLRANLLCPMIDTPAPIGFDRQRARNRRRDRAVDLVGRTNHKQLPAVLSAADAVVWPNPGQAPVRKPTLSARSTIYFYDHDKLSAFLPKFFSAAGTFPARPKALWVRLKFLASLQTFAGFRLF